MFSLSHCCQSPFPRWESQSPSAPQDALHQHHADVRACCGGSSASNLLLFLCVLASSVHRYQNWCLSFAGALSDLLHVPQTQSLPS